MGAWQWTRLGNASGVDHNIGHALLWPAFGLFLLVAGLARRRLERSLSGDAESAVAHLKASAARELPPGSLPDHVGIIVENDPATTAYNSYLAALNDHELQQQLRVAGLDRPRIGP